MKQSFYLLLAGFLILGVGCTSPQDKPGDTISDTPKIPDSVPQAVAVGKNADWAYMPDTSMNEIVLGDAAGMKKFTYDNGAEGESSGKKKTLNYFNSGETEFLTVFTTTVNGKMFPYGFRLQKNSDTTGNENRPHSYVTARNFLSGHGIYIGMPPDYVQNIYKSQTMMRWVKGDTTYLSYTPRGKDQSHFKRYPYTDYTATYKFVDDKCRVIEMMVKPEVFEQK